MNDNVDQRLLMEDRLHFMESVVRNAATAVLIAEADPAIPSEPRIVFVNEAFTRLTGFSPEEVIGETHQALLSSETDRSQVDTIRTALATLMPANLELLTHRKDGSAFWAEWNIVPIADKVGRYSHWVVIQRDISEQKATAEALRLSDERYQRDLENHNKLLEVKIWQRTSDLETARIEILDKLSRAAEFRDDVTGQHTQRVGRTSGLLAKVLGLPDEMVELIRLAAPLHDVGKVGIEDMILLKKDRLTPDEFDVMKTHTTIGGRILSGSQSQLLLMAETIALTHHECWDGSGYPLGLRGNDIPLAGRIVSVADVFDALTHDRPYKKAWSTENAVAEIERLGGSKFEPRVAEAFLQLVREGLLLSS